jgi:hypothetical protein
MLDLSNRQADGLGTQVRAPGTVLMVSSITHDESASMPKAFGAMPDVRYSLAHAPGAKESNLECADPASIECDLPLAEVYRDPTEACEQAIILVAR